MILTFPNNVNRSVNIENYAFIKFLRLPSGWSEFAPDVDDFDTRAIRTFCPPESRDVRLQLLNRGYPLSEDESEVFREVLARRPGTIFERKETQPPNEGAVNLIKNLTEILGNAGDNQVVNTSSDDLGPSFMLERIDIFDWKGRNVLALRGWYRDPDQDVRMTDYCGFFIDGNPGNPECQLEEIFLEAPTEELLVKYLPYFKECLNSLEWK
jgi:hypothetical protein